MALAIDVHRISKRFRINHNIPGGYRTLRESLMGALAAPLRNLRNGAALGQVEDFWALRDVSFQVEEGEVLGVIGRNGAGKSTLLKILTRITDPTSGTARLHGRVGSLLEVGTGFHPELTGRENVFLNGSILGMRSREVRSKFDQIVAFSGVEKFIDTPVKRYSSGMKVRLAFAVAAHLDLEILLIDEVLAVGDAEFQSRCLGKMGEVANSGRTVLFVSHNMAALQNLCPRSVLLNRGEVEADGPSDAVIRQYMSAFAANDGFADFTLPGVQRSGRGRVRIESVRVLNGSGQACSKIGMGNEFTIRLKIRAVSAAVQHLVGIAIFNQDGARICGLNSRDMQNWSLSLDAGDTTFVDCNIPRSNLMPGVYMLSLAIHTQNKDAIEDHIQHGVSFEIVPQDVYGTGKTPAAPAMVYFDAHWDSVECHDAKSVSTKIGQE